MHKYLKGSCHVCLNMSLSRPERNKINKQLSQDFQKIVAENAKWKVYWFLLYSSKPKPNSRKTAKLLPIKRKFKSYIFPIHCTSINPFSAAEQIRIGAAKCVPKSVA